MAFFSCASTCGGQDKVTDTVKVAMPAPMLEEDGVNDVQESSSQQDREQLYMAVDERFEGKLRQDQTIILSVWKEHVEAEKIQREQEAALKAEEERVRQEQEEADLAAQRQREEAEAEAVRQEEAERAAQARKEAVQKFMADCKFKGVNTAKKTLMATTYPLHEAAKRNDAVMVRMLIEEGAKLDQTNSRKQTPLQRAQQEDKKGSHAQVINILAECAKDQLSRVGGA